MIGGSYGDDDDINGSMSDKFDLEAMVNMKQLGRALKKQAVAEEDFIEARRLKTIIVPTRLRSS